MNTDVKDYVAALREAANLIEVAAVGVYGVGVGADQAPYIVTVHWSVDSRRDAERLRDRLVDAAGVFVLRDERYGSFHYMRLDSEACPQVSAVIVFREKSGEETNNA